MHNVAVKIDVLPTHAQRFPDGLVDEVVHAGSRQFRQAKLADAGEDVTVQDAAMKGDRRR